MWQFLCGFGAGVYAGTFYNCKPCLKTISTFIKENMPEKDTKENNSEKKNKNKNLLNNKFLLNVCL